MQNTFRPTQQITKRPTMSQVKLQLNNSELQSKSQSSVHQKGAFRAQDDLLGTSDGDEGLQEVVAGVQGRTGVVLIASGTGGGSCVEGTGDRLMFGEMVLSDWLGGASTVTDSSESESRPRDAHGWVVEAGIEEQR